MFRLVLVARGLRGAVPQPPHWRAERRGYDLRESDTTATRDACARAVKELVDGPCRSRRRGAGDPPGPASRAFSRARWRYRGRRRGRKRRTRRAPSHSPERNASASSATSSPTARGRSAASRSPKGRPGETWSVSAEGVALLAGTRAGTTRNKGWNKAGTRLEQPGTTGTSPSSHSPLKIRGTKRRRRARGFRRNKAEQGAGTRAEQPGTGREQPCRQRAPRVHAADTIPPWITGARGLRRDRRGPGAAAPSRPTPAISRRARSAARIRT